MALLNILKAGEIACSKGRSVTASTRAITIPTGTAISDALSSGAPDASKSSYKSCDWEGVAIAVPATKPR
ncbi:hypothetical protein ES703_106268 [subsurface metagenome]